MKRIVKILTVIITAFTFSALFISASTFAQPLPTTVTIKPSLSISIPSSTVSLSLDPSLSSFGYASSTVTVATNNPNGYKLYIETEDNDEDSSPDTALVNTNNTSYTIPTLPTLSGGYTEDAFIANYWGYRISSGTNTNTDITSTTNYFPYTSNTMINYSNTATNGISSTIDFASKIDYEKPAGQYNIALSFKALPQTTTYYMQDFAADPTLKDTVCTEDPTMVTDKRDGHTYAIAKLKDDRCWMVQNLRLGENLADVNGVLNLTAIDSNVGLSGFVLTNKLVSPGLMPAEYVSDDTLESGKGLASNISAYYCTSDYGCYYNWYTATAGSGSSSSVAAANTDVEYSICPAGWSLPTGASHNDSHVSELRILANAYGYGTDSGATVASRLLVPEPESTTENLNGVSSPGLLLGGGYNMGGSYTRGVYGRYWSRTGRSSSRSCDLYLGVSDVYPGNCNQNYFGKSVRCLAQ